MKDTGTDSYLFEQYKRRQKRGKRIVFSWQLVLLAAIVTLWELASKMFWIDPSLFSSPFQTIALLFESFSEGSMLIQLQTTVLETMAGFIVGTFGGIMLATTLWSSERFPSMVNPYLVMLNAMPKVALGPIIIVALGPGYMAIIVMGAASSAIVTTRVIYSGFKEVDSNYIKVLKSFGASRWQIFKEAIFPATLPTIISTLKMNVCLSWVGVIVGEFLVAKEGLGYLVIHGVRILDFTLVMSSLLLIAIFSAVMYKIVERMEHWLNRHLEQKKRLP